MLPVSYRHESNPARMLAMLMCKADAILSYTEELNRQAYQEEMEVAGMPQLAA